MRALTPIIKKRRRIKRRRKKTRCQAKKILYCTKAAIMDTTKKVTLNMYAATKAIQEKRLLVLERSLELYNCTQGQLLVNNDVYDTLELPWRENKINISRIPTGVYTYQKIKRSSNGSNAIWLRDVPGRGEILIHYGTKPSHTKGCILLENYEKFHSSIPSKGLITIL